MSRTRVLTLGVSMLLVGCSNNAPDPVAAVAPRTVASMLPRLSRSLTPAAAEAAFGQPDERAGSGIIIYIYRAESGKRVSLGFPGFAPIIYAKVQDSAGVSQELPLVD